MRQPGRKKPIVRLWDSKCAIANSVWIRCLHGRFCSFVLTQHPGSGCRHVLWSSEQEPEFGKFWIAHPFGIAIISWSQVGRSDAHGA